jgi:hypothetical protein
VSGTPRQPTRSTFRRLRIAALLGVLLFTAAWGARTSWHRHSRARWDRPLQVGLVLLDRGGEVDAELWRRGASVLSSRLAAEAERWRGPGPAPFQITVVGPLRWEGGLPMTPASGSFLDRIRHAVDVWSTSRDVDRLAGGDAGGFDLRVLFLADSMSGGAVGFAEGSGALNGEVALLRGSATGDLSIPLQAIGHELLHTVGATDKYDASGHARDPDGLADPDRAPRYPQVHAEWMVGEIPTGPGRGRLADSLEELQVGPATAREIGWARAR